MHLALPAQMFLLVAATESPATAPSTRPAADRPVLQFVPEATPDAESVAAGAVPFYNDVSMNNSHWVDYFTGWGCVTGAFKTVEVSCSEHGESLRFRAICRTDERSPQAGTVVEWLGDIVNSKVTGEMIISAPGPAAERAEIAAVLAAKRERFRYMLAGGAIMEDVGKMNAASREVNLVAARGRKLRFTFTAEVGRRVIPPSTNGEVFKVTPAPVRNSPMRRAATAPAAK